MVDLLRIMADSIHRKCYELTLIEKGSKRTVPALAVRLRFPPLYCPLEFIISYLMNFNRRRKTKIPACNNRQAKKRKLVLGKILQELKNYV